MGRSPDSSSGSIRISDIKGVTPYLRKTVAARGVWHPCRNHWPRTAQGPAIALLHTVGSFRDPKCDTRCMFNTLNQFVLVLCYANLVTVATVGCTTATEGSKFFELGGGEAPIHVSFISQP